MFKLRDTVKAALQYIGCICLILVSVVLFAQTAARYLFHYSFFWADELAKYSVIWGALLCSAAGLSDRAHTALDFVFSKLPIKLQNILRLVLDLVYTAFCAAAFYFSLSNVKLGMKAVSAGLGIRMGYVYLALTVTMAFMVFFLIYNIADDIKIMRGAEKEAAK